MLIACKQLIPVVQINITSSTEIVAVDLLNPSQKSIRVIVCYNPHESDILYLKELLKTIENLICSFENYIIIGDMNIDFNVHIGKMSPAFQLLNNFINFFNCKEIIDFPTRGTRQLDHIFINNKVSCKIVGIPPIGLSDHISVLAKINYSISDASSNKITFLNFNKANYNSIVQYLTNSNHFSSKSELSLINRFEAFIALTKTKFVPVTKLYKHRNKTVSAKVYRLFKKLRSFYRKFKSTGNKTYLQKYKILKSNYRICIKQEQCAFEQNLLSQESKLSFYKYIKSRSVELTVIFTLKNNDGRLITDPTEISNIFN